jgi:virulence-associated protein VapD
MIRFPDGIGHNRGRSGRMYAIVFDFDTQILEELYPSSSWRNAYTDVRTYLTQRGFDWKQGSVYFGNHTVDAVRCVRVVQKLAVRYPWFKASVRDIRMLRIEENNDLTIALDDSED